MFKDISHYDARRKKRVFEHTKDADREPNGRVKRGTAQPDHLVYFVQIEGNPRIKVGRSHNITGRISQYEYSSGSVARCLSQLRVQSDADAVALENHVVALMAERYPRYRREWFLVPRGDVGTIIEEIVSTSPVAIISRVGAHMTDAEPTYGAYAQAAAAGSTIFRQYKAKRH